jgi:hypothetical protein
VLVIPADLLPHTLLWQEPTVSEDASGNDVLTYPPGTSIRGWVQQQSTSELVGGRDTVVRSWLLICNQDGITPRARFTWQGLVFDVDGQPAPVFTPQGFDHSEVPLRRVTG